MKNGIYERGKSKTYKSIDTQEGSDSNFHNIQ